MKALLSIISIFFVVNQLGAQHQSDSTSTLTPDEREVFIQGALEYRNNNKLSSAISFMDSILSRNPHDAGALLLKGDLYLQQKKFGKAVKVYNKLLPLDYKPIMTRINLSYALFLTHKPQKALELAKAAWELDEHNVIGIINYFNAFLWNKKTKEAHTFLLKNDQRLDDSQKLLLKARLYMTEGKYTQGLKAYEDLTNKYKNKYFTIEYAEALIGKKEYEKAEKLIYKDSVLFNVNELNDMLDKSRIGNKKTIGSQTVYFKDIANNVRYEEEIFWQQKEANKHRLKLGAKYTSVRSGGVEETFGFGIYASCDQRWSIALKSKSSLNLLQLNSNVGSPGFYITGKQELTYQPNDRKMIGASVSSDILNYTAELYAKATRLTELGYKTHLMFSSKSGFYSEGSAGLYSDNNKRLLVFSSIYHTLRSDPTIKSGINIAAAHFSNQNISDYFSPKLFLNTEGFLDFMTPMPHSSKLYFYTLAAIGVQKIEANTLEPAFRIESKLGANFTNFNASLKFQASNVSNEFGTGYKYNWLTFNLSIKF